MFFGVEFVEVPQLLGRNEGVLPEALGRVDVQDAATSNKAKLLSNETE